MNSLVFDKAVIEQLLPDRRLFNVDAAPLEGSSKYSWKGIDMGLTLKLLQSNFYAPLRGNVCVPIIPTDELSQAKCGICQESFADHVHYPVMVRCGHVFGEVCVFNDIAHSLKKFELHWRENPGNTSTFFQNNPYQCPCPILGCRAPFGPVAKFIKGIEGQWVKEKDLPTPPKNTRRRILTDGAPLVRGSYWSLYAMSEDLSDFHNRIYMRWKDISEGTPQVKIEPVQESVIGKVHGALMLSQRLNNMMYRLLPGWQARQQFSDFLILGPAVQALARVFERYNSVFALLTPGLIGKLVNELGLLLRDTFWQPHPPHRLVLSDPVTQYYLQKMVEHSLVAMRIAQEIPF